MTRSPTATEVTAESARPGPSAPDANCSRTLAFFCSALKSSRLREPAVTVTEAGAYPSTNASQRALESEGTPVTRGHAPERRESTLTLLGLVEVVQECAESDAESVGALCHLFASGRARLATVAASSPGRSALQRDEGWAG